MAGKMDTKTRIVKCPRCWKILAEPQDVLLYECGGCGTKLQAKKRNNSAVDTTSQRVLDGDSSGKQKLDRVFVDQEASSSSNEQSLLSFTDKSDQNSDHIDLHGENKDQDAAKRAENGAVDASPSVVEERSSENLKRKQLSDNQQSLLNSADESFRNSDQIDLHSSNKDQDAAAKRTENGTVDAPPSVEEYSSENMKMKKLSDNQEPCSRLSQQALRNSTDESDQNSDHIDLHGSHKDQDSAKRAENGAVDAPPSVVEEYSSENLKRKQLSDYQEPCCSSNQQSVVNLNDEPDQNIHNDPRSSTELSGHEDPTSSPEATVRNSVKRHETEFLSCRKEIEVEESSSEFEEAIANTRIISDSDGGLKSSFRIMIADKLLDTRQKKSVHLDEDDLLSEDGSADLHHRRRFDRISSVESMETARLGGINYYGYEGSVSSLDGNDDHIPRKNHIGSMRDGKSVDSGNRYRFNRPDDHHHHPLYGRISKNEHRSTDVRSFYGSNEFHENPRYRPSMIPENPKMERIELLKLVRELQDQLERTNISNPQQVPSYHNHVLNNPGRYGQRMAFSGEATAINRRRDGSSCHHCCPQDRHFSAQLPRRHVCCNGPSYGPGIYHSPRISGSSSPKHIHSESEFSAPDEHWHQNDVVRPFRSPKKKQYVRPIAGGSPWITCYRCFKVLQLPQSFLLFNKRYHSLRCGACMKVLNFTLSDRTHVSRYYPDETVAAPPSSEAEDCDKLGGSWAGPVSCSDRSFEKSYSTETDRNGSREFSERRKATFSRDPSGSTRPSSSRVSGRRTTTSEIEEVEPGPNGYREFSERRKVTLSRDPSSSTRPPSSRISGRRTNTSEIEEVEPRPMGHNGSPLHWLMGYASPSKVIRGL